MDISIALVMLAWFLGAFIGSVCGLGGVLVAMPLMLLVLPMHETVLISALVCCPLTILRALVYHSSCDYKELTWLLVGILPGSFAGVLLLKLVPEQILEISLGVLIIGFVIAISVCEQRLRIQASPWRSLLVGFLASLTGAAISVDGPILGIYGLLVAWNPLLFLGISSLYYAIRCFVTCLVQWQNDLYSPLIWEYALYALPATLLGFALSVPVVRRINVFVFRTLVKILLIVSGLSCFINAF